MTFTVRRHQMLRGSQTNLKAFFQLSKNKRKLVSADGLYVVQYTAMTQQQPVLQPAAPRLWTTSSGLRSPGGHHLKLGQQRAHAADVHVRVQSRDCSSCRSLVQILQQFCSPRQGGVHTSAPFKKKYLTVSSSYEFNMFIHNIKTFSF